jgi:hypothetical protein
MFRPQQPGFIICFAISHRLLIINRIFRIRLKTIIFSEFLCHYGSIKQLAPPVTEIAYSFSWALHLHDFRSICVGDKRGQRRNGSGQNGRGYDLQRMQCDVFGRGSTESALQVRLASVQPKAKGEFHPSSEYFYAGFLLLG